MDGAQTQQTPETAKTIILNQNKTRQRSRWAASTDAHPPAAVEVTPSPEKRVECAHTTGRPYPAAARAPVS